LGVTHFPPAFGAQVPTSPYELRHYLKKRYLAGRPVAAEVQAYRDRAGDHSFDSFQRLTSRRAEGMRLEDRAKEAWVDGDSQTAWVLFQRAYQLFLKDEAISEAAFCLFFCAEILSEREHYAESLEVADRALAMAPGCLYLAALVHGSRGYSLWYQDRLRDSAEAFSHTAEIWLKLAFPPGIVVAWNNLANLYREMHLPERAEQCYREALAVEEVIRDEHPDICFYLESNVASLLAKKGDREGALLHLARARRYRHVSPEEFLFLAARVEGVEHHRQALRALTSGLPSLQIEKSLLLGEAGAGKPPGEAEQHLRRALELSLRHGLRQHRRRATLALGQWLESMSRYEEAAELYKSGFREEENLVSPELLLPYSQAVSPLFDGWVRCLVRARRPEEARRGIHSLVRLRRAKAAAVQVAQMSRAPDELHLFVQTVQKERAISAETGWSELEEDTPNLDPSRKAGYQLVELWPIGNCVYAWICGKGEREFKEIELSRPLADLLEPVLSEVYSASSFLPIAPASRPLQRLYGELVRPLGLENGAVALVVHKELQSLPFEMLQDDEGNYLIERFSFSYLPAASLPAASTGEDQVPAVIFPPAQPALPGIAREEALFRSFYPEAEVLRGLAPLRGRCPSWLHISAHFRLDLRFWLGSFFSEGQDETNALAFSDSLRACRLVSLGVCDAGNSYSSICSGGAAWKTAAPPATFLTRLRRAS
jgi:tetratricopeptide (TPR) repeat protein